MMMGYSLLFVHIDAFRFWDLLGKAFYGVSAYQGPVI